MERKDLGGVMSKDCKDTLPVMGINYSKSSLTTITFSITL